MNGDDKRFIDERLIKLETLFKERWNNHDKRSDEIWTEIRENIKDIKVDMNNFPCDSVLEKIKGINSKIAWLWIIVVGLIGTIIKVAIKVLL